jgi:hypothetical protein
MYMLPKMIFFAYTDIYIHIFLIESKHEVYWDMVGWME